MASIGVLRNTATKCVRNSAGVRNYATATAQAQIKPEGDISSVFVSLSGGGDEPLPARFAELKQSFVSNHAATLQESWTRLLNSLRHEVETVRKHSSAVIPQIEFKDLVGSGAGKLREDFLNEVRRRGVAIVKGVVAEKEARAYKGQVEEYVRKNPGTKAFPPDNPQVYELYWTEAQLRARAHPNLLATQKALMSSTWHSKSDPSAPLSIAHPTLYADRLRIRQPGDATFALGPHVDGGSVERWEPNGYGLGHVYDAILAGKWEDYDPWDAVARLSVQSDLYNGAGACTMFRMFQAWLSMSVTGPGEGTLRVNPMLKHATAYYLLRPFFAPRQSLAAGLSRDEYLAPENWAVEDAVTSQMQGATPGRCQELNEELHPHLDLSNTMVDVPKIRPGDYVIWHCDTIHAVDPVHNGSGDSSVLYIPVCPLTETNAAYLARQRDAFLNGTPGPDFPGGKGESEHIGRPEESFVKQVSSVEGLRGFGFEKWNDSEDGLNIGQGEVLKRANILLGFAS